MTRVRVVLLAAGALLASLPAASDARSRTTVDQTIVDADKDNRLEPGPGESYVVRDDLGQALPTRAKTRSELFYFGQLTDTHVVDEESPLRVEFLDKFGPPLTGAYRPEEGLSTQVLDSMVNQLRNTTSPVSGRKLQLAIATGDNSDNTQLNETRWFIDLMDGGKQIDPNSGIQGTCGVPADHLYDGVRGGNEYYEPNSSATPGADNEDGPGYSPDQSENEREKQRTNSVRDFPGLFEDMNKPFQTTGFGDIPWYSVFGNHDALLQGNAPRNPVYEQIATGCTKLSRLSSTTAAQIQSLAADGVTPADQAAIFKLAIGDEARASGNPDENQSDSEQVPSDPKRRPLRKAEWMQQHCTTTGFPKCHGFTPADIASGMGYYSFNPRPGLRFVVLDTIAENGGDGGNVDSTQFNWLHDQLRDAESKHELVVAFAHHSLETMNQAPLSVFGVGDNGGDADPLVHYGMSSGGPLPETPCTVTDPALPPTPDETLRCLFLRHPSVIAYVNGHEHNNRINPFERRDGMGKTLGGFWQINTAAHIDWPQQSRTVDIVDDRDGNLSLFGTAIDQAGSPNPGGAPPSDGSGESPEAVQRMASISRELSYNDPDALNGEDGRSDARGSREDRNVELIVRNPYAG